MTSTTTIRPNSVKQNATGRANYSYVSDSNDSTYVEWGSGDNNLRDEYYLSDLSSSAYAVKSLVFYQRGQGVGAVYETFRLFDSSNNEICAVVDNWLNSVEQNSVSDNTVRTVAAINGAWCRTQPWEIDILQKYRQLDTWVDVTWWSQTEATPTVSDEAFDGYKLSATFTRAITDMSQTVYVEYSLNGGSWTALTNGTNSVSASYSAGTNGQTIRLRGRCTFDSSIYSDYVYTSTYTFDYKQVFGKKFINIYGKKVQKVLGQ